MNIPEEPLRKTYFDEEKQKQEGVTIRKDVPPLVALQKEAGDILVPKGKDFIISHFHLTR